MRYKVKNLKWYRQIFFPLSAFISAFICLLVHLWVYLWFGICIH
nr:MAG TPA: hypothetical protein [Caudoviricetes sp.]